jgi:hypothetical protein
VTVCAPCETDYEWDDSGKTQVDKSRITGFVTTAKRAIVTGPIAAPAPDKPGAQTTTTQTPTFKKPMPTLEELGVQHTLMMTPFLEEPSVQTSPTMTPTFEKPMPALEKSGIKTTSTTTLTLDKPSVQTTLTTMLTLEKFTTQATVVVTSYQTMTVTSIETTTVTVREEPSVQTTPTTTTPALDKPGTRATDTVAKPKFMTMAHVLMTPRVTSWDEAIIATTITSTSHVTITTTSIETQTATIQENPQTIVQTTGPILLPMTQTLGKPSTKTTPTRTSTFEKLTPTLERPGIQTMAHFLKKPGVQTTPTVTPTLEKPMPALQRHGIQATPTTPTFEKSGVVQTSRIITKSKRTMIMTVDCKSPTHLTLWQHFYKSLPLACPLEAYLRDSLQLGSSSLNVQIRKYDNSSYSVPLHAHQAPPLGI